MRNRLLNWAQRYSARRPADFVVGENQLERWYIIRCNKIFNIYLHRFNESDEDRALHDHPWISLSFILGPGGYIDYGVSVICWKSAGSLIWRLPTTTHRIVLTNDKPVYTLFFTGPVVRNWGFHCPQGWRRWEDFVSVSPGGKKTGRGCD